MRLAYGVSVGPVMVAVQARRLLGSSGNAETPGVEDIMSCMSSVWRLLRRNQPDHRKEAFLVRVPLGHTLCIVAAGSGSKFRRLMGSRLSWGRILSVLHGVI